MTQAQKTLQSHDYEIHYYGDGKNTLLDAMSIHAQKFAEFTSLNWWSYDPESKLWFGEGYPIKKLTTSDLYTIFDNQESAANS